MIDSSSLIFVTGLGPARFRSHAPATGPDDELHCLIVNVGSLLTMRGAEKIIDALPDDY
jgi:hypothetical protein